ncbi:diaminopimelate epimerase [Halomarina oriensis]|uniref:Diaminopimelate epimerase n=1 Tax=Halomarina oriensis TaxID=671145 RepID=A0A6B0GNV3_9EURY|nr:diaminopimelate epimerase [Halomarina oriensis]
MNDSVRVEKYHGAGNDFLVVPADASVEDRFAFTAEHCDRETGLSHPDSERTGADGVLFLSVDGEAAASAADPPRVGMTHHQPDGSIAEMCGNGVRCAALWAARELGIGRDTPAELVVVTPAGERRSTVDDREAAASDEEATVTVSMGRPSFDPADVPLAADRTDPLVEESVEGLTVTAVNTGVPHAVAFVESVDAVDLDAVAPPVRHADVFPEGTNVVLAAPADDGFDQRTFERGVEGETDACGTGAVAVGAVARRRGLVGDGWVTVRPPGGPLSIRVTDDEAFLRGPAEREFETTLAVRR